MSLTMPFDNNVKLIELNQCRCGRKPTRSTQKGHSRLGTPFFYEIIRCRSKSCRRYKVRDNVFSARAPNKAAAKWNKANPIGSKT